QAGIERACPEGPQSELTLVRENSMPVGSGRVLIHLFSINRTNVLSHRCFLPAQAAPSQKKSILFASPPALSPGMCLKLHPVAVPLAPALPGCKDARGTSD